MFSANTFQTPNFLIDDLLTKISGNALKILLIIIRKTRSFSGNKISLSLSDLQSAAAISRNTALASIRELEALELISVDRADRKISRYALPSSRFGELLTSSKIEPTSSKNAPDRKTSAKIEPTSSKIALVSASSKNEPERKTSAKIAPATPASARARKIDEEENEEEKKDFERFLRETVEITPNIRSPRRYAAKMRVKYAQNDQYTLALFKEWKNERRKKSREFQEFKSRWIGRKLTTPKTGDKLLAIADIKIDYDASETSVILENNITLVIRSVDLDKAAETLVYECQPSLIAAEGMKKVGVRNRFSEQ
ncbi:MAG: replication protein [Helicobacteraceae bacterium]|jgi:hypothetical protein|nr:replication protein [Helicobacteraceae bacterium]